MKTKLQHIATLPEPYKSEALKHLKDRPRAAGFKHKSLYWALVWTLPAGELKRNPFWLSFNNTLAIN